MNFNKILFHRSEMDLSSREYVNYCYELSKKLSDIFKTNGINFLGCKEQLIVESIDDSTYELILNCILDDDIRYDEATDGSIKCNSGFLSSWRIMVSEKSFLDIRYNLGAGRKSNIGNTIFIEIYDNDGYLQSRIDEIWSETIEYFQPDKARITCSEIDKALNPDLNVDFNLGVINYFSGSLDLKSFRGSIECKTDKFPGGTEFYLRDKMDSSGIKDLISLQEYMVSKGYISDDDGF